MSSQKRHLFLVHLKAPIATSSTPNLFPPVPSSPQQVVTNVSTDGMGRNAGEARRCHWGELGLIEGGETRRVGVPSPQVHLWGKGHPSCNCDQGYSWSGPGAQDHTAGPPDSRVRIQLAGWTGLACQDAGRSLLGQGTGAPQWPQHAVQWPPEESRKTRRSQIAFVILHPVFFFQY